MASRLSLTFRALIALALMVGFYLLALGVIAGLGALVYWDLSHSRSIHSRVVVGATVGAGVIAWSLLPRPDRFAAPGPRLTPEAQPRLFRELEGVARAVGQPMPSEVYLIHDLNAWVSQRGGWMGIGSRRVMGLGLPLMVVLRPEEMRAVIAHEFGHFDGGDTRLSPVVYRTRSSLERTVEALDQRGSALRFLFFGYAKLFFLVSFGVSRRQELAADRLAARVVGARALASGLRAIEAAAELHERFIAEAIVPVLTRKRRPSLADGFARFLRAARVQEIADSIRERLKEPQASHRYDTHPSISERVGALGIVEGAPRSAKGDAAISLLDGVADLEKELCKQISVRGARASSFEPIAWDDFVEEVCVPHWTEQMRKHGKAINAVRVVSIPALARSLPSLGRRLSHDAMNEAEAAAVGATLVSACLALALRRSGWTIHAGPGTEPAATRGDDVVLPFSVVKELTNGTRSEAEWKETCERLGIADLPLVADEATVTGS